MATIESQIGTVASGRNPQQKTYVVDDPTLDNNGEPDMGNEPVVNPYYKRTQIPQQSQRQQIQAQVQNSSQNDEKIFYDKINELKKNKKDISPESKRKIEALLGLRKIKKSITIDDTVITLQNLNSDFTRLAFKSIAENSKTNIDIMFYSRNVYLALSLFEINGEKVSDLLQEDDETDVDMRLAIVDDLAEEVVKELQSFYEKEIGVKIPENAQEIREVNSEIKKS